MTVKELKNGLSKYPDDMPVYLAERVTEYDYGLLNSIEHAEIEIDEDNETLTIAIILTEE